MATRPTQSDPLAPYDLSELCDGRRHPGLEDVPAYEQLPKHVKDNIPPSQWPEVVHTGATIPDGAEYINLKSSIVAEYVVGETANGPLLPLHSLSRAHGRRLTVGPI